MEPLSRRHYRSAAELFPHFSSPESILRNREKGVVPFSSLPLFYEKFFLVATTMAYFLFYLVAIPSAECMIDRTSVSISEQRKRGYRATAFAIFAESKTTFFPPKILFVSNRVGQIPCDQHLSHPMG